MGKRKKTGCKRGGWDGRKRGRVEAKEGGTNEAGMGTRAGNIAKNAEDVACHSALIEKRDRLHSRSV